MAWLMLFGEISRRISKNNLPLSTALIASISTVAKKAPFSGAGQPPGCEIFRMEVSGGFQITRAKIAMGFFK